MNTRWEAAVKQGDIGQIRHLLDQGADANALDRHGQTALMLAAHGGHRNTVDLLIAHGADPNRTAKYGLSALMLAIVAGHRDIARALLAAGADFTSQASGPPAFGGKTAQDLAVERDMADLFEGRKPKPQTDGA